MVDEPNAGQGHRSISGLLASPRVWETAAVIGVFALAAWLRLGWPGVNSFSFDEARVSLLALQMARGSQFAALGMQSSTGVPNFPAAVWIFVLPYSLSTDPLLATLFVGLLGTLAVVGLWWLSRRAWGPWAALCTALLFAASPFAVFYSRSIWSQDLLPPLAVLWAVAMTVGISRRRPWAIALATFLAGFILQVHYAGVALIVATVFIYLRFAMWKHWRAILSGGALAAVLALPFVYTIWCCGEGARADLENAWQQPVQTDLTALQQLSQMGAGDDWERLLLGRDWTWEEPLATLTNAASWATAVLIVFGLAVVSWQAWHDWRERRRDWRSVLTALAPAWALSTSLFFLSHKTRVYFQYQLVALPALFLAAGALAGLGQRRTWKAAVMVVVLAITVLRLIPLSRGLDVVSVQLTPGGIGTPLYWPRAAAQTLKDGSPIVVHTHGDIPEFFGDAAAFDVLLWDYPHRVVDGRSVLLIPEVSAGNSSAHILSTFADLPAWEEAQSIGLSGSEQTFLRREGEPPYVALTVAEVSPKDFQQVAPVKLQNGMELQGWRVRALNGQLRFTTWWKVIAPPASGDYHQFNHLRSEQSSDPIAIRDVPLSSQAWQVGDTLITWVDFDPPAESGSLWVDVGMYTWPSIERSPVLDRPGDPLAPIRLGPLNLQP